MWSLLVRGASYMEDKHSNLAQSVAAVGSLILLCLAFFGIVTYTDAIDIARRVITTNPLATPTILPTPSDFVDNHYDGLLLLRMAPEALVLTPKTMEKYALSAYEIHESVPRELAESESSREQSAADYLVWLNEIGLTGSYWRNFSLAAGCSARIRILVFSNEAGSGDYYDRQYEEQASFSDSDVKASFQYSRGDEYVTVEYPWVLEELDSIGASAYYSGPALDNYQFIWSDGSPVLQAAGSLTFRRVNTVTEITRVTCHDRRDFLTDLARDIDLQIVDLASK